MKRIIYQSDDYRDRESDKNKNKVAAMSNIIRIAIEKYSNRQTPGHRIEAQLPTSLPR